MSTDHPTQWWDIRTPGDPAAVQIGIATLYGVWPGAVGGATGYRCATCGNWITGPHSCDSVPVTQSYPVPSVRLLRGVIGGIPT